MTQRAEHVLQAQHEVAKYRPERLAPRYDELYAAVLGRPRP